jgi:hypothetical protein
MDIGIMIKLTNRSNQFTLLISLSYNYRLECMECDLSNLNVKFLFRSYSAETGKMITANLGYYKFKVTSRLQ